jgi:hypothetical protein
MFVIVVVIENSACHAVGLVPAGVQRSVVREDDEYTPAILFVLVIVIGNSARRAVDFAEADSRCLGLSHRERGALTRHTDQVPIRQLIDRQIQIFACT